MTRPQPSDSKLQALRQSHTFNPRAKALRDPLFQETDFFDPRDLPQVKYEMLRRAQKEDTPVSQAAAAFGFSRPSFYKAQEDFSREGLAGLIPRKRGPKRRRKLRPEILEFAQQIRLQEPALKIAGLVQRIQERFSLTVHRRSLERALLAVKKKTTDPPAGPTPACPPQPACLTQCYEQLRQEVLDRNLGGNSPLGQAVLVHRGVVAWMHALGPCLSPLTAAPFRENWFASWASTPGRTGWAASHGLGLRAQRAGGVGSRPPDPAEFPTSL